MCILCNFIYTRSPKTKIMCIGTDIIMELINAQYTHKLWCSRISFFFFSLLIIILNFTTADGKPVDATQELLATGLCNIGNSFFHAFPGSGSFSRSAVNASSGVRTPLGGLYSGENIFLRVYFEQRKVFKISYTTSFFFPQDFWSS